MCRAFRAIFLALFRPVRHHFFIYVRSPALFLSSKCPFYPVTLRFIPALWFFIPSNGIFCPCAAATWCFMRASPPLSRPRAILFYQLYALPCAVPPPSCHPVFWPGIHTYYIYTRAHAQGTLTFSLSSFPHSSFHNILCNFAYAPACAIFAPHQSFFFL